MCVALHSKHIAHRIDSAPYSWQFMHQRIALKTDARRPNKHAAPSSCGRTNESLSSHRMRLFSKKYRLLGWLSLVLALGFLTTSIAGYIVSRDSVRQGLAEQALPLTGDNIYSEIQKDLLGPVFVSSLMAHDTFLRDWILHGEDDPTQIVRYLKELKQKYSTDTSFLVSARTHQYYNADGILKSVQENEPSDKWFFRVQDMKAPYETNVGSDLANRDTITISINHRVLDYEDNFIGVAGVGLTFDTIARLLDSYQARFHRHIYFVDAQGAIVLDGKSTKQVPGSIDDLPGMRDIAANVLNRNTTPTQLEYRLDNASVLVNSRFIPELGWYLVVEQNIADDVRPVQWVFIFNLAISAAVILLVLVIMLFRINRYQRRLKHIAATDSLTNLMNRQTFEILLQQSLLDVKRSGRPLSVILFDIDRLKDVNGHHGHSSGDQVLSTIAQLGRDEVRENDIIARWNGKEFVILLRDCPLESAYRVAEKLRDAIAGYDFALTDPSIAITASFGVAEYGLEESETRFFARADKALHDAKAAGRNCVEVSMVEDLEVQAV